MIARIACLMLLLSSAGCTTVASWQRHFQDYCRAKHSLHTQQANGAVPHMGPYERHFQNGFKAGYTDVTRGGDGTEPILPPTVYSSYKYRDPCGRDAVNAWYEGFKYGADCALQEGTRELNYVAISPRYQETARAASTPPASTMTATDAQSQVAIPPPLPYEVRPPNGQNVPAPADSSAVPEMRRLPTVDQRSVP